MDFVIKEDEYGDLSELNSKVHLLSGILILTVNVRSLEANFAKLEIFIERLKFKPDVLICTESWKLKNINFYKLRDYVHYYNYSNINQSDGVIIYCKKSLSHRHEIVNKNKSVFMSTIIKCNDVVLKISGVYRSHTLPKDIFT